jgi:hypothetical protein
MRKEPDGFVFFGEISVMEKHLFLEGPIREGKSTLSEN